MLHQEYRLEHSDRIMSPIFEAFGELPCLQKPRGCPLQFAKALALFEDILTRRRTCIFDCFIQSLPPARPRFRSLQ